MSPTATFRPHERLKDPADFRRAFERRRWESDGVLVIYGVKNGRDHSRLGISIARKKVRAATDRNRLKRLIREAFRLGKSQIPSGLDLVVVAKSKATNFEHVLQALPSLAQKVARRLEPSEKRPPATL
jgi:ribonuclease P protein component